MAANALTDLFHRLSAQAQAQLMSTGNKVSEKMVHQVFEPDESLSTNKSHTVADRVWADILRLSTPRSEGQVTPADPQVAQALETSYEPR